MNHYNTLPRRRKRECVCLRHAIGVRREAACRQTSHLLANDRFTKTSVMRSPLALAKPSLYDP
ncbi:hypothetical protein [Nostoc sp.]|uniref:hypothetical protein n=1 Tax=Nostoc sp. TaxID=1180 RepID=UPI002FF4CA38